MRESTAEVTNEQISLPGEVSTAQPDQSLDDEIDSQPSGSQELP